LGFRFISATLCISEYQLGISGDTDKWEMLMKSEVIGAVFACRVVSDISGINLRRVHRLGLG
jgi:hypothetical protein